MGTLLSTAGPEPNGNAKYKGNPAFSQGLFGGSETIGNSGFSGLTKRYYGRMLVPA
jgi:hypothetical protein